MPAGYAHGEGRLGAPVPGREKDQTEGHECRDDGDQNTAAKSSEYAHISPTASSGPRNAPTVSSDWRSPKAAPRKSGGAMSATSASRGAPRMPLPTGR